MGKRKAELRELREVNERLASEGKKPAVHFDEAGEETSQMRTVRCRLNKGGMICGLILRRCCRCHRSDRACKTKKLQCQRHASMWAKKNEQIRDEIEKRQVELFDNAKKLNAETHQEATLEEEIENLQAGKAEMAVTHLRAMGAVWTQPSYSGSSRWRQSRQGSTHFAIFPGELDRCMVSRNSWHKSSTCPEGEV